MRRAVFSLETPGSAPDARTYFLLLVQKKVAKEKDTPGSTPRCAGFLALLGGPGGLPELACGSDKASRQPSSRLRCSAPPKGAPKASQFVGERCGKRCLGACAEKAKGCPMSFQAALGIPPSRGRRRATQGFAERGRGLSEPRSGEFRSTREGRVAQGTGRSPASTPGRLFFANFLLAKQKKVRSPVSGETQRLSNTKRSSDRARR